MDNRIGVVMSNLRKAYDTKKGLEGYYSNRACDTIAKCVDYCFSERKLASFKNPFEIAKLIDKNRRADDVLGSFGKVTISMDRKIQGALIIRNNTNCENPSKVRMVEIIVKPNGKPMGVSRILEVIEDTRSIEGFTERELSRITIKDLAPANKNMNEEARNLCEKMKICSDLFTPVMKCLDPVKGVVKPVSKELEAMIEEIGKESRNILAAKANNK